MGLDPIGQDEGAQSLTRLAAAGDPDPEADDLLAIDDDVLLLRLKPFRMVFRFDGFSPEQALFAFPSRARTG